MKAAVPAESMFASYAQLTKVLLPEAKGIALLDGSLAAFGHTGSADPKALAAWLRQLGWTERTARIPTCSAPRKGCCATAIPLERTDGTLLGVLCIVEPAASAAAGSPRNARSITQKLKPVLDSLHRELAAVTPERTRKQQVLTERTAELEWLFKVTANLHGATDDRHVLEELLSAATERLKCSFGVIVVPDRRLTLEHVRDAEHADLLRASWQQAHKALLTWVERRRRPLLANGTGRGGQKLARCKLLAVPIMRDSGRVMGLMAFFNAPDGADFERRHIFLARHLGKQTAGLVEAQFDLMTGLYTREGLTQMYRRLADPADGAERSVLYVDIDHMHVVNELHGFELGNELIVRIADLLAPPLLPEGALAARISADRFAVVFPDIDTRGAVAVATRLQEAAGRLALGPAGNPVDVSLSCGVAVLIAMPQGLARALAAAEIACKSAKNRGRRRVELYACDDQSMMRRHDDVVAVGQLRSAFKSDRLLLYAQRIVPLQNASLPGG
ncbi:MAG TPA: GGDEF domain-containing protein, partial [Steroidobacteraceae bacterium]|nr:GGDEF domain-containing protein [Steroidobacteraceae bacterium]